MFKDSIQDIFYKNVIYIFIISTLSTQSYVIQSQINLEFHCSYLEITWKIHEISCHQIVGTLPDLVPDRKRDFPDPNPNPGAVITYLYLTDLQ